MKSETVGAYRILRECGRGSYGAVYLAESTVSKRRVALKILNGKHDARELEGLIRYRECRHANLIQIHHLDRLPDGRLYYTMDAADDRGSDGTYVPDTLASRGRLSAAELIPMLRALLDGVAALHKRKVIHRDIKPENILFVEKVPVLGDVGLTAPIGNASMVGTPSFLPPEVLSGARPPDERSDLYALGRVAYVALTGLPPRKYPQIPKDLPPEAAPVLAFCRAANAGDATLESCRAALDSPPRRSVGPLWLIAAALLLAVVAAVAVVLFTGRDAGDAPQEKKPETSIPATTSVPPPSAIPVPQTDAEIDAASKNTETELAQKMRKLDAEVAASQTRMRESFRTLSPEEFRAAVGELERRYPVSAELLNRAKARYETVNREHFEATRGISPFTREGAAELAARNEALKRLEAEDPLYRLGVLTDGIESAIAAFSATRHGIDLALLEKMFRERREAARQWENMRN